MAPLWALTGSMDPRRVQDAKVTDIVHDDSKVGVQYTCMVDQLCASSSPYHLPLNAYS
jgi:hypothetical protein